MTAWPTTYFLCCLCGLFSVVALVYGLSYIKKQSYNLMMMMMMIITVMMKSSGLQGKP